MKLSELKLIEMATPTKGIKEKIYFHGTKDIHIESILKDGGIKAPILVGKKSHLTPVEGKTYITPSLKYAAIYLMGGDLIGSNYFEEGQYGFKEYQKSPIGYMLVLDGDKLIDVQPDEDSIGELVYKNQPAWLFDLAQKKLTSKQLEDCLDGVYYQWAAAGKKLVKLMTDEQKLELIEKYGAHIAHTGFIPIKEVWKFDKKWNSKLEKDCSNFFELAERIR